MDAEELWQWQAMERVITAAHVGMAATKIGANVEHANDALDDAWRRTFLELPRPDGSLDFDRLARLARGLSILAAVGLQSMAKADKKTVPEIVRQLAAEVHGA